MRVIAANPATYNGGQSASGTLACSFTTLITLSYAFCNPCLSSSHPVGVAFARLKLFFQSAGGSWPCMRWCISTDENRRCATCSATDRRPATGARNASGAGRFAMNPSTPESALPSVIQLAPTLPSIVSRSCSTSAGMISTCMGIC